MKKTALTLAFLLTLCSFTACGDTSSTDEASKSVSSSSAAESSEEETTETETTTEEETTEAETTEAEESAEESDAETSEEKSADEENLPAAENTDFKRGVVEDNVYKSEYAGFQLTAPEGWTFAQDDYILNMMNISVDLMNNNTELTKAMLDQVAIYDAVCIDQATGRSIMIEYENLAKEVPDPDKFTVDDYIASIDKQLSAISAITFTRKGEPETVTLGGEEFTRVVYSAENNGMTVDQVYYMRRVDKFMLGIVASSGTTGEDMTAYEQNFAALS